MHVASALVWCAVYMAANTVMHAQLGVEILQTCCYVLAATRLPSDAIQKNDACNSEIDAFNSAVISSIEVHQNLQVMF